MSDESDADAERKRLDQFVREQQPSWRDEFGIRGPQPERYSLREQQAAPVESQQRREGVQPAFPEASAAPGGGNLDATSVDVYGADEGEPATFHFYQSAPPTPVEEE